MKYVVITMFFIASTSFAASNGPDVLYLKNGAVFPHKAHQGFLKSECKQCHRKGEPGKIEGFGKDHAHRMCKTCHTMRSAGPTSCKDCHKK
jgi:hypothetical protein